MFRKYMNIVEKKWKYPLDSDSDVTDVRNQNSFFLKRLAKGRIDENGLRLSHVSNHHHHRLKSIIRIREMSVHLHRLDWILSLDGLFMAFGFFYDENALSYRQPVPGKWCQMIYRWRWLPSPILSQPYVSSLSG